MNTGNRDEHRERSDKGSGATGRANDRESIWTISKGWQVVYFAFFTLQMVSGMSVIFWYHVFEHVEDSVVETLIGMIQGSASVSVGSAGISYTLAEGARILMILSNSLEQWINRKWDERDARNRAVGLEEGRAVERAEWRDWNRRRLESESRGETFDEPMPGSDNGSVHIEED